MLTTRRARLVETMGLVPGSVAQRALLRVAASPREPDRVRQAAVAALGDRGVRDADLLELIGKLATADDELGAVAALAAFDLGERSVARSGQRGPDCPSPSCSCTPTSTVN